METRQKVEAVEPPPRKVDARTRLPRQLATAQPTKRDRIRPSLSDQLASIASNSSALIINMKECIVPGGGDCKDKAVLLLNLKASIVGRCESLYSSPIQFFKTRCHYTFHHPVERRVEMEMNYRDMASPTLDEGRRTFSFRVHRQLGGFPKPCSTRCSRRPASRIGASLPLTPRLDIDFHKSLSGSGRSRRKFTIPSPICGDGLDE